MQNKLRPSNGLATLAIIPFVVGCSQVYLKYANGIPSYFEPTDSDEPSPLVPYTGTPNLSADGLLQVPAGSYIQFQIERVCFQDLPSWFGDANKAWVGSTLMADDSRDASDLFTRFTTTLGSSSGAAEVLRSARPSPLLRLPTNAGRCITPSSYLTPPVPLNSADPRDWPRFLFTANVLTSKDVDDFEARVSELNQQVQGLSAPQLEKFQLYSGMVSEIASTTASFLRLVKPDRVILWAEATLPVVAGETENDLRIPSPDHKFVYLHTNARSVKVPDGTPSVPPNECVRDQSIVNTALETEKLSIRPRSAVVVDSDQGCADYVPTPTDYGAPYTVFSVRVVGNVSAGDEYWEAIRDISIHAAQPDRGYGYNARVSDLNEITTGEVSKLLSGHHRNTFVNLKSTVESALRSLELVTPATGDTCLALSKLDRQMDSGSLERYGAAPDALAALEELRGALQKHANTEELPCNNVDAGSVVVKYRLKTSEMAYTRDIYTQRKTGNHHCDDDCDGEPTRTNYSLKLNAPSASAELREPRLECIGGPCHGWNHIHSVAVSGVGQPATASWDVWSSSTTWKLVAQLYEPRDVFTAAEQGPISIRYDETFSITLPSNAVDAVIELKQPGSNSTATMPFSEPASSLRLEGTVPNGSGATYTFSVPRPD